MKIKKLGSGFSFSGNASLQRVRPDIELQPMAQMLGKLKDMGNWLLGKVGLSLDNFQTTKDPATGNVSIQFTQNPPPK